MSLPSNWKNLHTPNGSTLIMGILNVTTDSFSDGGQFIQKDNAIDHALEMEKSGADHTTWSRAGYYGRRIGQSNSNH